MKSSDQWFTKTTLVSVFAVMILISLSCTKDTPIRPLQANDALTIHSLKSPNAAKATRAIRAKLSNAPTDPVQTFTGICGIPLTFNDISGNMTHLGKLQIGSIGEPVACELGSEPGVLQTVYHVNYIGAHGDEIRTIEYVTLICGDVECLNGTFEGTIDIIGGTGRFENATGEMVFVNATFEPGPTSKWELVGTITY